jgi:invasion protein IalB
LEVKVRMFRSFVFPIAPSSIARFAASGRTERSLAAGVKVASCLVFIVSTSVSAGEVDKRGAVGAWSVYCTKGVSKPRIQDCSVVTGVVGETEPTAWLKIGFVFISPAADMTMTLRTPRLNYFKKGISIAVDGRQIARAFIDSCNETSCQTTIPVDARMLKGLATAETATFQYQVTAEESVGLLVKLDQFIQALGQLRTVAGLTDISGGSANLQENRLLRAILGLAGLSAPPSTRMKVEIRKDPYAGSGYFSALPDPANTAGEPLKDCHGAPAEKEVKVSADLKVEDGRNFEEWLSRSKACAEGSVFWIRKVEAQGVPVESGTPLDDVMKYLIYDIMKDRVPKIVTTDRSEVVGQRLPN